MGIDVAFVFRDFHLPVVFFSQTVFEQVAHLKTKVADLNVASRQGTKKQDWDVGTKLFFGMGYVCATTARQSVDGLQAIVASVGTVVAGSGDKVVDVFRQTNSEKRFQLFIGV
jgi:hypothetical protein